VSGRLAIVADLSLRLGRDVVALRGDGRSLHIDVTGPWALIRLIRVIGWARMRHVVAALDRSADHLIHDADVRLSGRTLLRLGRAYRGHGGRALLRI